MLNCAPIVKQLLRFLVGTYELKGTAMESEDSMAVAIGFTTTLVLRVDSSFFNVFQKLIIYFRNCCKSYDTFAFLNIDFFSNPQAMRISFW